MARAEDFLGEVLSSFDLSAPVVGAVRFGQGHINDTFVVHTQPEDRCCRRFILQRAGRSGATAGTGPGRPWR